jgi:hypothetical protein
MPVTTLMRQARGPHMLNGIAMGPLLGLLADGGAILAKRYRDVLEIVLRGLQSAPLSIRERRAFAESLRVHHIHPRPIFIIGHFRSGTTYLHDLLVRDSNFAYPTTFQVFFPGVCLSARELLEPAFKRSLPERRCADDVRLDSAAPHEDEFALGFTSRYSFYHGLYFPRKLQQHFERAVLLPDPRDRSAWKEHYRAFLTKVSLQGQGLPLVLKNPAHSARIPLLLEMFPEARFVHIQRNPFAVYLSTLHLYRTFIDNYAFHELGSAELQEAVLSIYEQLMRRLFEDLPRIPEGQLAQVCYEDLLEDGISALEGVYTQLGLDDFARVRDHFSAHISAQKEFRTNGHRLDEDTRAKVWKRWEFAFARLGYDRRSALSSRPAS